MNIEITDELAIELADAHVQAFTFSGCDGDDISNYGALVEAVGKLLVLIPDPRAPKPVDIPVTTIVLDPAAAPAPKRGKLTKHQREVYGDIVRWSRRRLRRDQHAWVDAQYVGSKNACDRLVEKGWIEMDIDYGPRGGELRKYRPIIEGEQS